MDHGLKEPVNEWVKNRINDRYKIRDKYFHVKRVEDNGIVTRVYMPESRIRPAVFFRAKGKRSRLEPVRFIDKGQFYIVHKILDKGETIVLKSGKRESLLKRR